MKAFLGITSFVILGLLTAAVLGFANLFSPSPLPYDYEQKGLGKQIVIKFSYVVAANTPKGLAAVKFASLVNETTHGRVKVELFPDGSLYNEFDELDALQKGTVQMIAPDFSMVSGVIPQWAVMDLPFAFANEEAVQAALNGDIGTQLLQTLGSDNMVGLAFWNNGFRQLTNDTRPLIQPSDLKGLNFRIEQSKVSEVQFQVLQATTVPLPFNQLYNKLEIHTVDGEENSVSNIYSQKLYEVQKYATLNNISYLGYVVLANKTFWDGIPPDLQNDIQKAMNTTTTWERQEATRLNQQQLQELKHRMQVIELTPAQKMQWLQQMKPVYAQFSPLFGDRLMNDIQAIQQAYGP